MRTPLFRDHPSLRAPELPLYRVLVIVAPTDGDVRSVRALWRKVRRLGVALLVASECQGEARGEDKHILNPNLLLVDAATREWDAVIVAGGRGAARVAEDPLARAVVERARLVAAFGEGRALLDRSGVDGFIARSVDEMAAWLVRALVARRGATMVQHGEAQTSA